MALRTRGRPDVRFCKSGQHEWTPENIIQRGRYKYCILCRRAANTAWIRRNRKPRDGRRWVGPVAFFLKQDKIDAIIQMSIMGGAPIKWAAKQAGISHTTARKIYWAERDRRQLEALRQR